jgi:hypothetical protein
VVRGEHCGGFRWRMSYLVLAGKADCAQFARAEFMLEYLGENLPQFRADVSAIDPKEWAERLTDICKYALLIASESCSASTA